MQPDGVYHDGRRDVLDEMVDAHALHPRHQLCAIRHGRAVVRPEPVEHRLILEVVVVNHCAV